MVLIEHLLAVSSSALRIDNLVDLSIKPKLRRSCPKDGPQLVLVRLVHGRVLTDEGVERPVMTRLQASNGVLVLENRPLFWAHRLIV